MTRTTKTLLLASLCGSVSGVFFTAFMDASRVNNYPLMLLFSVLYLAAFMLMWRVIRHYRKLKGWEKS